MYSPVLKSLASILFAGVCSTQSYAAGKSATAKPGAELQPVFTHYAKTLEMVTFRSTVAGFSGAEMQEADDFDGGNVSAELVIPHSRRFQIMLAGPIYTWGRAKLIAPGSPEIDLYGWSGLFQYPNAQLQWQFLREEDHGVNLAASGGYGRVIGKLKTTTGDALGEPASDIYNHGGSQVLFGVKADRRMNDWLTLLGNVNVAYYISSDDLHPDNDGDTWALTTISAAGVFHPWEARVYPTLELVYNTDFGSYNAVTVVPEVIIPVCRNFEFKLAGVFGLTTDGEQFGGRFEGVFRF